MVFRPETNPLSETSREQTALINYLVLLLETQEIKSILLRLDFRRSFGSGCPPRVD